jgi:hypothetical protein
MTVWAQRREEVLRDCLVSPDVFNQMVDRLGAFVVPYQHALETEAGPHYMHFYLQGLLSHVPRKNAEEIATLVAVERGSVLDVEMAILDKQSKGVAIDEQANDDVVHLYRLREADRLAD